MITRRSLFLLPLAAVSADQCRKLNPRERVDSALKGDESIAHHSPSGITSGSRRSRRRSSPGHARLSPAIPHRPGEGDERLPVSQGRNGSDRQSLSRADRALGLIRDGLDGRAYFVETIFNPWNVAEKMTSKEEVLRMKKDEPQKLLDMLEPIGKSEANHARRRWRRGRAESSWRSPMRSTES